MNVARFAVMVPAILLGVLIGGCSDSGDADDPLAELDPAIARALNDPLMSDPDLVAVNEANAALTRSSDHSLPADVATPEAIRDAQDRAVVLLGGTRRVPDLPLPEKLETESDESPLILLDDVARPVPGMAGCMNSTRYGAGWAGQMPAEFPVFPRGAVIEAFGANRANCTVRAVRFRSPVPNEDIARFYLGRARTAGYGAIGYAVGDSGWQLTGHKAGTRFLIRSRQSILGLQEIDLVTYASGAATRPR